MADVKEQIRTFALEQGFDEVGFAPADVLERDRKRLEEFVEGGEFGEMGWMADKLDRRSSPKALWSEVKSVIVLAANYGPDRNPLDDLQQKDRGAIAAYARNKDYHDLLKKRLKRVGRWMQEQLGGELKVFVDTAPVMEKPLAARSGIGWQGKHTNLVSRDWGSWLFLGEIFTSLELEPDAAESDHCGNCRACIDICPTQAITEPYKLDARRCISYLTIEHKGPIPLEFRNAIGNRIYGCDDCLAICPWNKFAKHTEEAGFLAREEIDLPLLKELAELDDQAFRERFRGSPIKRTGRDRFVRNVMIALGNSGDISAIEKLEGRRNDESELVREAAIWALEKLKGENR